MAICGLWKWQIFVLERHACHAAPFVHKWHTSKCGSQTEILFRKDEWQQTRSPASIQALVSLDFWAVSVQGHPSSFESLLVFGALVNHGRISLKWWLLAANLIAMAEKHITFQHWLSSVLHPRPDAWFHVPSNFYIRHQAFLRQWSKPTTTLKGMLIWNVNCGLTWSVVLQWKCRSCKCFQGPSDKVYNNSTLIYIPGAVSRNNLSEFSTTIL